MMAIGAWVKHSLLWAGAMSGGSRTTPKVVFYHDVGRKNTPMGTCEDIFWSHADTLASWNKTQNVGCKVCFDDGFRGIWESRERFQEQKIRPTVFLAVRLVGRPGYLTWDEIRCLERDFGFVFQCHTWSHQTLAGPMIDESPKAERSEAWFYRELVESKIEISNKLGHEISELCFPVGYFNEDVVRRCKDAGYAKVYSSVPGNAGDGVCGRWKGYVEPRCLCQFLPLREFKLVLRGGMNLLARRYFRMHYVQE